MGRFAIILLAVALLIGSAFVIPKVTKDLITYCPLNENGGKISVDRYRGNNGTLAGNALPTNNYVYFDGSGDYISYPAFTYQDIVNRWSMSLWAKLDNTSQTFKVLIGKQNNAANNSVWCFVYGYNGANYAIYSKVATGINPQTTSTVSVTDLNWHHIVYTYSGTVLLGYVDGVLQRTLTSTFTFNASTKVLTIGAGDSGLTAANSFAGKIKQVRMYNRAITAQEVKELYIAEK